MRAIDTNVLVRLIVRDDPEQVGRAEAFVEHGAWISLPVLAETVRVLTSVYGVGRGRIGTVVSMLMEHDRLALQDESVRSTGRCRAWMAPIGCDADTARKKVIMPYVETSIWTETDTCPSH